mmetsp:Transcript_39237/g.112853  ORF Transcript_39237/g.112853 Transcript_39237/m.112853 type:complete len:215 (+) Transcript_39237:635-1279(+)
MTLSTIQTEQNRSKGPSTKRSMSRSACSLRCSNAFIVLVVLLFLGCVVLVPVETADSDLATESLDIMSFSTPRTALFWVLSFMGLLGDRPEPNDVAFMITGFESSVGSASCGAELSWNLTSEQLAVTSSRLLVCCAWHVASSVRRNVTSRSWTAITSAKSRANACVDSRWACRMRDDIVLSPDARSWLRSPRERTSAPKSGQSSAHSGTTSSWQ